MRRRRQKELEFVASLSYIVNGKPVCATIVNTKENKMKPKPVICLELRRNEGKVCRKLGGICC